MRKRDEIKQVFEKDITALEEFAPERLRELTTEEVKGHFSNVGETSGQDELIQALTWTGMKMNVSRRQIVNFVVRTDGERAQQSAYEMVLMGYDNGSFLFPFEYGGKYVNSYVHTEEGWKICEIRYDMDWEKGNTYFAKDWKFIDYKIFAGHRPMISSEYDSPWAVIPENDEELSDEEQIQENMFKYSFGLDNCDWTLHKDSYTDDIVFYSGDSVMEAGARNLINNFKNTSHKEPALEHAIKIVDIQVNGDEAILIGYRIEPHRLGSKNLNRDTLHQNFYSARYRNKLKKIEGKWKMYEIHYKAGVFFETSREKKHYVDEF